MERAGQSGGKSCNSPQARRRAGPRRDLAGGSIQPRQRAASGRRGLAGVVAPGGGPGPRQPPPTPSCGPCGGAARHGCPRPTPPGAICGGSRGSSAPAEPAGQHRGGGSQGTKGRHHRGGRRDEAAGPRGHGFRQQLASLGHQIVLLGHEPAGFRLRTLDAGNQLRKVQTLGAVDDGGAQRGFPLDGPERTRRGRSRRWRPPVIADARAFQPWKDSTRSCTCSPRSARSTASRNAAASSSAVPPMTIFMFSPATFLGMAGAWFDDVPGSVR